MATISRIWTISSNSFVSYTHLWMHVHTSIPPSTQHIPQSNFQALEIVLGPPGERKLHANWTQSKWRGADSICIEKNTAKCWQWLYNQGNRVPSLIFLFSIRICVYFLSRNSYFKQNLITKLKEQSQSYKTKRQIEI